MLIPVQLYTFAWLYGMFEKGHAIPALLLLIIVAALPSCVMTQCSPTNPDGCTTCATCVSPGVGNANGSWYSTAGANCGSNTPGTCVIDKAQIPCASVNGNPFWVADVLSHCSTSTCVRVQSNVIDNCVDSFGDTIPCSSNNAANCNTNAKCAEFNSGLWFNSDRSATQTGKSGLCHQWWKAKPCSSFQLYNFNGVIKLSNTPACSNAATCETCIEQVGVFIKSTSDSTSGSCRQSYTSCDSSFYNNKWSGCSSSNCLKSACSSGGVCTIPTPTPSSSTCSSGQTSYCLTCTSCTRAGGSWSSSFASNPATSSNTDGTCYSSFNNAPCGSHVFSWCTISSVSQSYRSCPQSGPNVDSIIAFAVGGSVWLINIILVAIVARRKGLNPCLHVALAVFLFVFAWIGICCGQSRAGADAKIQETELRAHDGNAASTGSPYAQASAITPGNYGNYAPELYTQSYAPNPFEANFVGVSAPNPYAQPQASAPDPYAQPSALFAFDGNRSSTPNTYSEPAVL
jgi:hypothetical protein